MTHRNSDAQRRRAGTWRIPSAIALIVALAAGCGTSAVTNRELTPKPPLLPPPDGSPYLKAHLRNGAAAVFSRWTVVDSMRTLAGTGILYDAYREEQRRGALAVPVDSIALCETNAPQLSGATVVLSALTAVTGAMTVYCISNPKACFGSCPTFYADDGDSLALMAEGFSSSVLPSLEATDVDALSRAGTTGATFDLVMKNEALETHVVRSVRLCVAPPVPGTRVFHCDDGGFYRAAGIVPPSACATRSGDRTDAVRALDRSEYWSDADSLDLGAEETLTLRFPATDAARPALVMASRQSLMTTYLFYHTLALLGSDAVRKLAAYERGDSAARAQFGAMRDALGGITVDVRDRDGSWRRAAVVDEQGPIATDVRIIPLPEDCGRPVRVRLRFSRGLWRFDWLALASIVGRCDPLRLEPERVHRNGAGDIGARTAPRDASRPLVTQPGDVVTFRFTVPAAVRGGEAFVESRGYYLEWMRNEWMKDEDPMLASLALTHPRLALRVFAPRYKAVEASLERTFWESRYARP